ncbi:MAG: SUMF1/EgtB/PvdO family nonheme iron enzyme [Rhodoferax sp.]|nr:SUMF1/EgtB/PvdO family nonheme iron enzyme [Rhodoferax sp.]
MAVFAVHASAAETQERNLSVNAVQGKRIALVIGNSAYKDSPLKNPVNDARDMAATLRKLGFDVIEKTDANQKDMNRAIAQFGEKLRSDTVALFFYAGHGIQVRGKNYIIPVDAQVTSEASVRVETVDVDSVMDQLAVSPMNIVILDACRNNPFERKFRSVGGGLAQMDAPKGSLIAYATAPGKTAADGSGRNGLYTQELLKSIQAPGLTLESVFKRVRNGVMAASGEAQTPWESSSLTGDFYFTGPTPVPVTVAAPVAPAALAAMRPGASDPAPIEVMLWESVKTATTVGELQAYLNRYPNGFFADVAKARIAVMNSGAKEKVLAEGVKKAADDRAAAEEVQRIAKERADALAAQKVVDEKALIEGQKQAIADKRADGQLATITDRQPGEIIGTLVTKDSLTGNTVSSVEVKILEAGPDKTVYSSGDIIGRDGSVLQVRVGEVVLTKVSGDLWTLPLKAGTSGEAKVLRDHQTDMPGTIRWKSHSSAAGVVQIVADMMYTVYIATAARLTRSPSGKWTANYRGTHALPESTETSIQATIYSNMVSTKLNLVTAAVTSGSAGPISRQVIKDCTACPELVAIPAGDFAMGSNDGGADEKPIHRVNIKSFAMGKTEITQGQWTAVMGRNPSKFKDCGDNCPLEQVSWDDAQQYIQKLNTLSGLRYDLPSEAQWEYAARAGSAAKWYFGSDEGQLGRYAWTNANSNSKTQEVAQKQSNDFGLHDMHGNVGEWVQDCWNATYDAAPADGSAWLGGNCGERVWRGGSWDAAAQLTRAAVRHRSDPVLRSASHLGFRVARALP